MGRILSVRSGPVCATAHRTAPWCACSPAIGVSESTELALGWSVKKSLLGKTVYNEVGKKVGKVQVLIIAPDKNLSCVIVGAGGFVGIGRHEVAVPVAPIQDQAGRLVMAGATMEAIKSLPSFEYANDSARRDRFVARAGLDITHARNRIADLQQQASMASGENKTALEARLTALQNDLKPAEAELAEMNQAAGKRWKELEARVGAAAARWRKAMGPGKV